MGEALKSASERFSREQVRRILGLSERQLIAWERQGLVQPGRERMGTEDREQEKNRPAGQALPADGTYSFTDIITLKTLLQLRRSGVPPARLRLAHAALKAKLGEVEKPWSQLQIKAAGKRITVQFQGATMEPVTGQLLLDYAPRDEKARPEGKARIRRFERESSPGRRPLAERRAIAERFFDAGLRYEERGATAQRVIRAYQKAIEMNPQAVGAFINLGTVYYNLGQLDAAESCYLSALSIDPGYGLVHFNLGNVFDERNEFGKAREYYEEAVRLDPSYADPHYNLALVYEKLGRHGKARQQWLRYLKLDPASEWASYARQQLGRTPLRLVQGALAQQDLPATEPQSHREG